MEIKRATDIMIPLDEYPHMPYWFTLRQAIAELEKAQLDSEGRKSLPRVVLVFDEKYQLLGMVRRRDILQGLEPEFLSNKSLQYRKKLFDDDSDRAAKLPLDKLIKGIRDRAERPVSDVMQIIKVTVNYEDNIVKIIYEMVQNNLTLLPVLKDNEVVGVVRTVEVFREAARLLDK